MLFRSLDGIVPVRYDVLITGYEMYVMRLLAGLRYEVLICVFAVSFVYSEYKNHTLIHKILQTTSCILSTGMS